MSRNDGEIIHLFIEGITPPRRRIQLKAGSNITITPAQVDEVLEVTLAASGGGGGTTDHAALASNLAWGTSGHTGTASRLAGFGGGGAAAYYQIGVDVAAYDAGLTSLTSADAAAGLPYVSAANTWTSLSLAADKGIYATSGSALATYDLTASGRALGGITLAATSVVVGTGAGTAGVVAATRGAVLTGGASGWTAPALGASGTFYQSNGTDAIWGSIGGGALGSILTTQGDILVRDASTVARLPIGAQEGMTIRRINGLVAWGFVLAATVATHELSEIGTVGTTNSTRAGSIGQEGTIV